MEMVREMEMERRREIERVGDRDKRGKLEIEI
jgi:hypothetical protein